MTTPSDGIDRSSHFAQARAALDAGDVGRAADQVERAERQARELKQYSIRWIAELLSRIGETQGEAAVEDALRRFGERNLAARALPENDWWSVPAEVRAKVVARAMLANGADVDITEDDEKIVMSFRCGSGGWLVDSGAYEGDDALLVLQEAGPRTFGRDSMWVYCAHCSVNNEMQAVETTGRLTSVEFPPERAGEPCVHHVYRRPTDIPDEVYVRIGKRKPPEDETADG
ncbi:MAG: hypothetical protein R8F63_14265 [Acidimicrobiales bacterium]|nr:hypothetical protein [Acidimicrobiales bacterium]